MAVVDFQGPPDGPGRSLAHAPHKARVRGATATEPSLPDAGAGVHYEPDGEFTMDAMHEIT